MTVVLLRIGERDPTTAAATRQVLTSDPDLEPVSRTSDPGSGRRTLIRLAATVAVVAADRRAAAALAGLRWAHFVGADENTGHVAVYQGLPIELFAGHQALPRGQRHQHRLRLARPAAAGQRCSTTRIRSDSSAMSAAKHAGDQSREVGAVPRARQPARGRRADRRRLPERLHRPPAGDPSTSLVYAGFFLALYFVAHLGLRAGLPDADPWLLPLAALLTAMGLTEIYRLNPLLARDQSVWIMVGVAGIPGADPAWSATTAGWSPTSTRWAVAAVALLLLTMVVGTTINGAKLWIRVGGVQVQPGEFAKLLLVIFLAGYLRERREVLRWPTAASWGRRCPPTPSRAAAAMTGRGAGSGGGDERHGHRAAAVRDLPGDAVRGHRPAAYTVVGWCCSLAGSWFVYHNIGHVHERFRIWLDPWKTPQHDRLPDRPVDRGDRRRRRVRHRPGQELPAVGSPPHPIIPAAQTDGIYAVWADEAGLAGAAGLLLVYLLFAYRGFKIATLAHDGFSTLLAAGLTFAFSLQAFLIVGGITRLVPLTGITLPFVSYGGSSIVSNFLLLALLLMVSNRTSRDRAMNHAITGLFRLCAIGFARADLVHGLLADLGGRFAGGAPGQRAAGVPPAADQARPDLRRQRPHGAGAKPRAPQERPDIYLRRYPFGALFGPAGRVQHGRIRAAPASSCPRTTT